MSLVNGDISYLEGPDVFSPHDIEVEPSYGTLPLSKAYEKGGKIIKHVIDTRLPAPLLKLGDHLGVRVDRFNLDYKSMPQAWHFDSMDADWKKNSDQALIVFGRGTGLTDVARPFEVPQPPTTISEANEMGRRAISRGLQFDSYDTGTLILSPRPFLHRRGPSQPGVRLAIDFGFIQTIDSRVAEWTAWDGLI